MNTDKTPRNLNHKAIEIMKAGYASEIENLMAYGTDAAKLRAQTNQEIKEYLQKIRELVKKTNHRVLDLKEKAAQLALKGTERRITYFQALREAQPELNECEFELDDNAMTYTVAGPRQHGSGEQALEKIKEALAEIPQERQEQEESVDVEIDGLLVRLADETPSKEMVRRLLKAKLGGLFGGEDNPLGLKIEVKEVNEVKELLQDFDDEKNKEVPPDIRNMVDNLLTSFMKKKE